MRFFWKKTWQGCTIQKSGLGMQQQIGYHNPNLQISNLEVPVGMVDGILANPRNPINHDLWLTGRFGTSRQPSLFLSLPKQVSMQRHLTNVWHLILHQVDTRPRSRLKEVLPKSETIWHVGRNDLVFHYRSWEAVGILWSGRTHHSNYKQFEPFRSRSRLDLVGSVSISEPSVSQHRRGIWCVVLGSW